MSLPGTTIQRHRVALLTYSRFDRSDAPCLSPFRSGTAFPKQSSECLAKGGIQLGIRGPKPLVSILGTWRLSKSSLGKQEDVAAVQPTTCRPVRHILMQAAIGSGVVHFDFTICTACAKPLLVLSRSQCGHSCGIEICRCYYAATVACFLDMFVVAHLALGTVANLLILQSKN